MAQSIKDYIVHPVGGVVSEGKALVNRLCEGLEPWQVVVYSGGATASAILLKQFLFHDDETLSKRAKREFFKWVKRIPMVKKKIEEEMGKATQGVEESMNKTVTGTYLHRLPAKGYTEDELMEQLDEYRKMGNDVWKKGMVSGTVYNGDEKLTELMAKTWAMFAWANPLHPDVFPDVRKMEAEVVRMCCSMFHGDATTCGTVTSGGTESIMLALLAYRNIWRDKGVTVPEIIVPVTAHAAFDKGASFFHMKLTHIPVDEKTRQVDVRAMRRAISKQTCVLVCSAPQFPHGIIDDVEAVAALGKQYGIPVHVDACLGGFLIPFMDEAGFPLKPFDFRVDGVTSISADTHKYGFAPKGSSVIMYKNPELRSRQFFVNPDWTGGIYASPTFAGSRAGAIIAACWASMVYFGRDGYVDSTKKIISTTRYIYSKISEIKGIFIFGKPEVSVIGIGSSDFNVFRLFDALVEKGWNLNSLQFPSSLHLCVTLPVTQPGVPDRFVADVQSSVAEIMKDPKAECGGAGAIYGMAQSIPDRSLVNEIAQAFLNACYTTTNPALTNGVNGSAHNGVAAHGDGK